MDDFQQLAANVSDALKNFGNEFTSVWLLIQLGLIMIAGAIGTLIAVMLRRRIDLVSLSMGWPPLVRLMTRLVLENVGTIKIGRAHV